MASGKASVDKKAREKFLRGKSFLPVKEYNQIHSSNKNCNGKGSHIAWLHSETGKVIILPGKPADGTWKTIAKTAAKEHAAHLAVSENAAVQFKRKAVKLEREITKAWQKDVNQRLRAGTDHLLTQEEFAQGYKVQNKFKETPSYS